MDGVLAVREPAKMVAARLNKYFTFINGFSFSGLWRLTYITSASIATFSFSRRLAVRAEALVGFHAPINPAGAIILGLARVFVIHFLAAQIAAGKLHQRSRFKVVAHNSFLPAARISFV